MNRDLGVILRQYLATALWSSNDESTESGGDPMDWSYSIDDFADESIDHAKRDIEEFIAKTAHIDSSDWDDEQFAHDLWLTRCGHGCGFWDRDFDSLGVGEALSEVAMKRGSSDPYVGDDGVVYLFPH